IPHKIAEKREHPHQDAIHAAGWVSLFTLHALWPFLWIWAMAYRPERGWGFSQSSATSNQPGVSHDVELLRSRVEQLSSQLEHLENRRTPQGHLSKIDTAKHSEAIKSELEIPTNAEPETA
ncbi:DUF3302 domain-containing protein, partial [Rhizobiaceae sp. 2RAB30]